MTDITLVLIWGSFVKAESRTAFLSIRTGIGESDMEVTFEQNRGEPGTSLNSFELTAYTAIQFTAQLVVVCVRTVHSESIQTPPLFHIWLGFSPMLRSIPPPPSIYTQYLIATKRKQNSRNVYKFIKRGKKEISLSFDWNLAQVIFEMFLHLDYCPPEVNLNDWTGF